jgi:hypothetical protein
MKTKTLKTIMAAAFALAIGNAKAQDMAQTFRQNFETALET